MEILDGKKCAENYYSHFPKNIDGEFHIITVGDDPASKVYVRNKIKACERLGITPVHKIFPSTCDLEEVVDYIVDVEEHNEKLLGIITQLPFPKEMTNKNDLDLDLYIYPKYDVDGFGDYNYASVMTGKKPNYYPATPKGIMMLLDYYDIDIEGKNVVIINRSKIVGKPLYAMLDKKNATITMCNSHTKNLKEITKRADIIITAVGKPKFINSDFLINETWDYDGIEFYVYSKNPVIIDVAMCRDENGKLCGDVDFESVKPYVSAITPVPGGVGPMTVCALMSNLVDSYENK